jgi:hypothetical protein
MVVTPAFFRSGSGLRVVRENRHGTGAEARGTSGSRGPLTPESFRSSCLMVDREGFRFAEKRL